MDTPKNSWWIPVGSFLIALLLSVVAGPARLVVARMAADPTDTDTCHIPTKKDGENDAGGKSDGKHFKTEAEGSAAEAGYVNDVESFRRKPSGEVRYFAGAKNGAKVPGLESKQNSSMRGWTLIHGASADNCCHTATLQTLILLFTQAKITKPTMAGTSWVEVRATATVDEFADNCDEKRPLKKPLLRSIEMTAQRTMFADGSFNDKVQASDTDAPNANLQFDADGVAKYQVYMTGEENWFFKKKTEMEYTGKALIFLVSAGPGPNQRSEGTSWVFKPMSVYSDADNGKLNECRN